MTETDTGLRDPPHPCPPGGRRAPETRRCPSRLRPESAPLPFIADTAVAVSAARSLCWARRLGFVVAGSVAAAVVEHVNSAPVTETDQARCYSTDSLAGLTTTAAGRPRVQDPGHRRLGRLPPFMAGRLLDSRVHRGRRHPATDRAAQLQSSRPVPGRLCTPGGRSPS
jgi:hypothetical protein